MIKIIKYDDLGDSSLEWLQAKHHFNFGGYFDLNRKRFGYIRVVNNDSVMPGKGFDTHPHKNMEIVTYIIKGAITHRDSCNNHGRITPGNIQVMSAGGGIFHSEYNLEDTVTELYQIWIEPRERNTKPNYQDLKIDYTVNSLIHLCSGDYKDKGVLYINQDVDIYAGKFKQGAYYSYDFKRQVYILVVFGYVKVNGQVAQKGDGIEITKEDKVYFEFVEDSEILIIDVASK